MFTLQLSNDTLPGMVEIPNLRTLVWAISTLLELVLMCYLLRKKLYRSHPVFLIYVLTTILQSAVVASSYKYFGPRSVTSFEIAWGSQAVGISARWFAVAEIARRALAGYAGIWGMTNRILFVLGAGVLFYSIAASGSLWTLVVLNADRAVELCIAAFIVGMLFFVRYYRLPMSSVERLLAIGFCLYSCFCVMNDSIYENWRQPIAALWNYLDILTFLATLILWSSAVRKYEEAPGASAHLAVSPEMYGKFSQKLNSRLQLLNNRLNHLLRSEDPRS